MAELGFFWVEHSIGLHDLYMRFQFCHFTELGVSQTQEDVAYQFELLPHFVKLDTLKYFLSLFVLLLSQQILRLLKRIHYILLLRIRWPDSIGCLQKFSQLLLAELSSKRIDRFASVHHVDCRHSLDLECLGDLPKFINIYFQQLQLASWFVHSFL